MTILSFCRRKKTNRPVHVDAGGGAAAPSPSSPAELPAEIIGHFGLQDQNCLQGDLDVSRRCNDILHSSGNVDAGRYCHCYHLHLFLLPPRTRPPFSPHRLARPRPLLSPPPRPPLLPPPPPSGLGRATRVGARYCEARVA